MNNTINRAVTGLKKSGPALGGFVAGCYNEQIAATLNYLGLGITSLLGASANLAYTGFSSLGPGAYVAGSGLAASATVVNLIRNFGKRATFYEHGKNIMDSLKRSIPESSEREAIVETLNTVNLTELGCLSIKLSSRARKLKNPAPNIFDVLKAMKRTGLVSQLETLISQ